MRPAVRASLLLGLLLPLPGYAQWTADPTVNSPVVVAPAFQSGPACASDGAGGAFFAWRDARDSASSGIDIWAQHLTSRGFRAWGPGGVRALQLAGDQTVTILPAPNGGLYLAMGTSSGGPPILQRLNAAGSPMWGPTGVELTTVAGSHNNPRLAAGPDGGVFVVWSALGPAALRAQRVNPSGQRLWGDDGVIVSAHLSQDHRLVLDRLGGVLIAWRDWRTPLDADVYAQRLDPSGNALWTPDGKAVTADSYKQRDLVADGYPYDGMVLAWIDDRDGPDHTFVQHVSQNGALSWGAGAVAVSTTSAGHGSFRTAVVEGLEPGGEFVVWTDRRNAHLDLYAQLISPVGTRTWGENGMPVCTVPLEAPSYQLLQDLNGYLFVMWTDTDGPGHDMVVQKFWLSNGTPAWPGDGLVVSSAAGYKSTVAMVQVLWNGAIAAWFDRRDDAGDIYAQRILSDGSMGPTVGVEPMPGRGAFVLALGGRQPVTSTLDLRLELPAAAAVDVCVFDPQGRRIATLANETRPAGPSLLSWNLRADGGARVAPGVYLAVARTGGAISAVRFVTLR